MGIIGYKYPLSIVGWHGGVNSDHFAQGRIWLHLASNPGWRPARSLATGRDLERLPKFLIALPGGGSRCQAALRAGGWGESDTVDGAGDTVLL